MEGADNMITIQREPNYSNGDTFAFQHQNAFGPHLDSPKYYLASYDENKELINTVIAKDIEHIKKYIEKHHGVFDASIKKNPDESDLLLYLGANKLNVINIDPKLEHEYDQTLVNYTLDAIENQLKSKQTNETFISVTEKVYDDASDSIFYQKNELIDYAWKAMLRDYPNQNIYKDKQNFFDSITDYDIFNEQYDNITSNIEIPLVVTFDNNFINKNIKLTKDIEKIRKIDQNNTSALAYLVRKQGYSYEDFKNLLTENQKNPFLQSVREEFLNLTSPSNHLAAFISLPFNDAVKMIDDISENKLHPITLAKNTIMGLYDPQNGGGSLLNITLKKDMNITPDEILTIAPDGHHGYSINQIYGKSPENFYTPIHPYTSKTSAHYPDLVKQNTVYALNNKTSVLLKPREGVDYSFNESTKKFLTNINQLYFQQIRSDHNYKNPMFIQNNKITNFPKDNETGHIYAEYSAKDKKYHYQFFYNKEQFQNGTTTNKLLPLELPLPRLSPDNDYPTQLKNSLASYFYSCFTGAKYTPDPLFVKNAPRIANEITTDKISLLQSAKQAFSESIGQNNTSQHKNNHNNEHASKRSR
jgi:hypothetical protein